MALSEHNLTENESIWLERMVDEDGTEWEMVFKGPKDALQKAIPRDQAVDLVLKGLATYLVGVAGHGEWGIVISDKGRKVLAEMRKPKVSQYTELTEDELIELASDLGSRLGETWSQLAQRGITDELVAVVGALKVRREASAPARRRVGEYLRQQAMVQAKYDTDMQGSDYAQKRAKKPEQLLAHISEDEWVPSATLLLADLQRLATPLVRDTKAEFFEEQEARLAAWLETDEYKKLTDKQKVILPCIAKGHIKHSYRGWRGEADGCTCREIHGTTMNAFVEKQRNRMYTSRTKPGFHHDNQRMMLLAPKPQ